MFINRLQDEIQNKNYELEIHQNRLAEQQAQIKAIQDRHDAFKNEQFAPKFKMKKEKEKIVKKQMESIETFRLDMKEVESNKRKAGSKIDSLRVARLKKLSFMNKEIRLVLLAIPTKWLTFFF